jgi:hypothetical protein
MLDEFSRTGKIDVSALPILWPDNSYVGMLKAARVQGLKIVAGDSDTRMGDDDRHRDRLMADTIRGITDAPNQNPEKPNKVIFVVGARHLDDYSEIRKASAESPGRAAEQLRQRGVSIATVSPEYGGNDYSPIDKLASSMEKPTMVSTTAAQAIGDSKTAFGTPNRTFANYFILFPERQAKTKSN